MPAVCRNIWGSGAPPLRILKPAQAQRGCREEGKGRGEEGRTVPSAGIPAFKLKHKLKQIP